MQTFLENKNVIAWRLVIESLFFRRRTGYISVFDMFKSETNFKPILIECEFDGTQQI